MANLTNTYSRLGRSAESRPLRDQLLEMQKRVLGAEHPNTLQTMTVLAQSYLNQGRHAEAAAVSAEVLEIRQRVLGAEHAETLGTMRSLAQIYREQGRQAEVVKLGAESLEIQRRVLGPTHLQTLTALQILARAQESTGNLVAAEALLRELQSLAPAHDSARSMLGLVLVKQGKFAEAETLLRPIQVARDAKQPDLWTTFVTRFSLGGALAGLGRNAEAEPLLVSGYEGLLQRSATIPSVDQERVTEAFEQLDHFYVKSDQSGKAAELRQGRDAHKHVEAGRAFERRGEFAKAIAEYVEATRLAPDLAAAWNGLAWTRATAPVAAVRDGAAAVIAARKACELTGWKNVGHIDTLAAAHAEAGEFDSAVEFQRKSLDLLAEDHPQRNEWQDRLALYRDRG